MRQIHRVAPTLRQIMATDDDMLPILRENIDAIRKKWGAVYDSRPTGGDVIPRQDTIEGPNGPVDLFIFDGTAPESGPKPCMIWLHGGGHIMGPGRDMWNGPLFAEGADCVVVSVDYRLAPEHPYPAALLDSFATLQWIHANASALNIDPSRIAIGGASAGGGLAAGLCLHNRDHGNLPVCFQLLLYPMLDNLHDTVSGQQVDHPIWCRADSFAAWEMYLNGRPLAAAPACAAPMRANDLSGLPPAFIPVGDVDLFWDENREYAARLRDAGVPATCKSYPGMIHAGEVSGAQTELGRQMLADYIGALHSAFHQANPD